MNKLTKIGVSALCGSLASVAAANAGSMDVTGAASATYTSLDNVVTGNPLGMGTNLTFTGNGELDNGSTFAVSIAHNHKNVYSSSSIALTTPSIGTFTYDEGGGTGIDRIDDMMPTAWEETTGTGLGTGLRTVSGVGGVTDLEWNVGMGLPEGMEVYASFAPRPDGSKNAKKAVGGDTGSADGNGWDAVIVYSPEVIEGLKVFGGLSSIEQNATLGDKDSEAYGATYAIGGATLGYQYSKEDNVGAASAYYENDAYGVSYSVNDDLSISYGVHESKGSSPGQTVEAESIQISYSVGGASLVLAETSADNINYVAGTNREGRTVALTLAF
jgi:outer membrane protein OmpU